MRWKKIIGWTLAIILLVLVVGGTVGYYVLHSRAFHHYVLAKIVQRANQATGGRVEIGDYTFHWRTLRADVYRIVIRGTEKTPDLPLVKADHLGLGLKIISAFRQKVDLAEVILDHPVVHLVVDKDGHSNIPRPQAPKQTAQSVNVFDLAVRHVGLNNGEIYYNDRGLALNAELHDLQTEISFELLKKQYDGLLTYHNGQVQFGTFNALQHGLEAQFFANPSQFTIDHIALTSGSSRVWAQAKLNDYSNPVIAGTYQAVLSTPELRDVLKNPALPLGNITMDGSLNYQNQPNRPFIDSVSLEGRLNSPQLAVNRPEARMDIRAIRGRFRIENGNLEASDLQAELLGGRLNAALTAQHLAANPDFRFQGTVQGVSLSAVDGALSTGRGRERVPITGQVNAKAQATWRGSMQNLKVQSDATITASTTTPAAATTGARPIPLNGAIHLRYDGARESLTLTQSYLRMPSTDVRLDGTLGGHYSNLNVNARSDNLHELDLLALTLRRATATSASSAPPQPFGLYGAAAFSGQLHGSTKEPRLVGQLTARNFTFQQSRWRFLSTAVALSPSSVALQHGDLETGTQGRITFDINIGLRRWSYTPSGPISIQATATAIPVGEVERLANLQYPVTGTLSTKLSIRGSQLNPAGEGSVQLTNGRAWNEPIQSLTVQFQGTGDTVRSSLTVRAAPGSATANVVYYPKTEGYDLQVDARGIKLEQVEAVRARNLPVAGTVNASVRGRGTTKAPVLDATVEIPQLQAGHETLTGIKAQANLANQIANLSLVSNVGAGFVQARGTVDLKRDYYATATLEMRGMPLEALLAAYAPGAATSLQGQIDARGSLKGPLKDPAQVEANIEIPILRAAYQRVQIANNGPIRIDYRNGILDIKRSELKGTGTDIQIQGIVPVRSTVPVSLSARGNVDLQLLSIVNRQAESSGQLVLDINATGDRAHPNVRGQVRIVNAAFSTPTTPLGVEKVNGEIAIQNNRADITQLRGQAGGGNISVQGFLIYQPGVQFNLALTGDSIRLRYPEGMRVILDPNLALSGTLDSATLNGQVLVSRLSFTKEFDLATFMSQFDTSASAPPPAGFSQNLTLDMGIQSTGELGLVSSKVSVQGQANLRVRGTAANPVIVGRVNVTDGEIFFLNHRYHIERGIVQFTNPIRTQPVLNLLATTKIDQFDLSLNLVGPMDRLRTTYTSDPPLPPVDIINLVTRGKTTEEASPANLGANSILAQGLASQVSSRVEKLAGISSLQIDPLIGGNNRNPSARIALQQRVTKNLIFTYAADVTSTQKELIQMEYQVTPRWSVNVVRDEQGNFSFEGRLHKVF